MEETPGVSAKGRWTSSNAVAKITGAAGSKPPIPCLETLAEGNTNSSKFRSTVTEPLEILVYVQGNKHFLLCKNGFDLRR